MYWVAGPRHSSNLNGWRDVGVGAWCFDYSAYTQWRRNLGRRLHEIRSRGHAHCVWIGFWALANDSVDIRTLTLTKRRYSGDTGQLDSVKLVRYPHVYELSLAYVLFAICLRGPWSLTADVTYAAHVKGRETREVQASAAESDSQSIYTFRDSKVVSVCRSIFRNHLPVVGLACSSMPLLECCVQVCWCFWLWRCCNSSKSHTFLLGTWRRCWWDAWVQTSKGVGRGWVLCHSR